VTIRLPAPCLVVLVGASGSGKSTWAAEHFTPDEVVSSDRLRAVVGTAEDDLDATDDAFALLDQIVEHRLRRQLTTVVDTLGLDDDRRAGCRAVAERHGVPCVAVAFEADPDEVRARNRDRTHPIPAPALKQQLARFGVVRGLLDHEGFAQVLAPEPVRLAAAHVPEPVTTPARPTGLRFGLHISEFPWDDIPAGLRTAAEAAEVAGFDRISLMDHTRQIPQVGRDWDPMLEPYTALAWLAALTSTATLGTLVSPVTFRNVGLLAKQVATIDVLSGGRAECGLGLGWYEREHLAYGWPYPPVGERYALLEETIQALRTLWGPGSKPFEGEVLHLPETIGYPRPLQDPMPILVGGSGERTLRLAARLADAVNLMSPLPEIRGKVDLLRARNDEIRVTHLAVALVGDDHRHLSGLVDRLRPRQAKPDAYRAAVNAGTIEDQVDRVRALVDAGVDEVIVALPDLGDDPAPVERFGRVIDAVR
jgi:alkanesulfonate monooxygenase SsuD/methylene tetrahydromethanopterin reductase-like flavin-dependent oxidoreductase (luciferase family)/predicted kinase